ncbi:DUF6603 domain-containing protein [Streptomyces chrestomyceticus]|uniref:DUF6603 domain-containing protein n=1 Tax=Streptomyces chrestomyceticus TaxID=68185 RepID=UPI0034030092
MNDAESSRDGPRPENSDNPLTAVPVELRSATLKLCLPKSAKPEEKKAGAKATVAIGLSGAVANRVWAVRVASMPAKTAGKRATALHIDAAPELGLNDLPFVGPRLPQGTGLVTGLAVLGSSRAEPTRWEDITALLGEVAPLILGPDSKAYTGTLAVGAQAQLLQGSAPVKVWKPLRARQTLMEAPQTSDAVSAGDAVPVSGPGTGLDGWVECNRTLGPLRVRRVGLTYRAGKLWLLLDASLGLFGINLDTYGLGLGVALDGSGVTGALDGLGLEFAAGPVRVAGALARIQDPKTRLMILGGLSVTCPQFAFGIAGMYAELLDGSQSVFAIGRVSGLKVPLGPVLLTGLIGGFGYNSRMTFPEDPAEVPAHPLVAGIRDSGKMPTDQGPLKALEALGQLVRPASGTVWAAAGAEFTLFQLVQARLVLAAQVAPKEVTVALLGLATVRFPTDVDKPYAALTMGVQAVFRHSTDPAKGGTELSVRGALDPDQSFVLDPNCRLSGGFALCTWLGASQHAGDFVLSLGGYHPAFVRPSHYPDVPRFALDWKVNGSVQVRAECYAAVTPAALMVGARLSVDVWSKHYSAWFKAHLDAVVQWTPFAYEVKAGIEIGVDIYPFGIGRKRLFGRIELWGPPTGGVATVGLPVVGDVAVRFGEGRTTPQRLGWDSFRDKVLANKNPEVAVADGLLSDRPAGGPPGVDRVTPDSFEFVVRTPVPCTEIRATKATGGTETLGTGSAKVFLRPMDKRNVTSVCTVTVKRGTTTVTVSDVWTSTQPQEADVPAAAFGELATGATPGVNDAPLVKKQLVGVRLGKPKSTVAGQLAEIKKKVLEVDAGNSGTFSLTGTAGESLTTGTRKAVKDSMGSDEQRKALFKLLVGKRLVHGLPRPKPDEPDSPTRFVPQVFTMLGEDPLTATTK